MELYRGSLFTNRFISSASHFISWSNVQSVRSIVSQHLTSDGYFECKPAGDFSHILIGFTDVPNNDVNSSNNVFSGGMESVRFGIELRPDHTVAIRENTIAVAVNVSTYVFSDTFRVVRTGTVITYYKIDISGNETLLYTSTTPSSGIIHGIAALGTDCLLYTSPSPRDRG